MLEPSRLRRDVFICAALTVLLSSLWILPHLAHLREVPDRGDPVFSAWRLARLAHQLRHDPAHLFDGNIFHPRRWTLAYSDATLLEGAAAVPFIWAGVDPLLVANALTLLAFPLCGLAFFYSGWRLTGDPLAGLVTGVLGAWYPFHAEHYSHLELQWFMFIPITFVAAIDTIADPTWRRGLGLGALLVLQCLASMYLGLMLATVLVPFAAAAILRYPKTPLPRLAVAAAAVAVVLVPVAALLYVPYHEAARDHGDRPLGEMAVGSAEPGDYLKTSRLLPAYSWHSRALNRPERVLYPGTTTLSLAAIGLVLVPAKPAIPLLVAGAAAFDWSLGLNGLSYRALNRLAPYRNIRVPARFAIFVGAVLILLAGYGAHYIASRGSRRRQIVTTILTVATITFDLRMRSELVDYYAVVPSIYSRVPSGAVLAEFPAGREIDYMYFSTTHWSSLEGGYSGFIPRDDALAAATASFPARQALDSLRARGATHLTYNCAFERSPERCRHNLDELENDPQLELMASEQWQGARLQLYRFR